jgi:hypothetical protein
VRLWLDSQFGEIFGVKVRPRRTTVRSRPTTATSTLVRMRLRWLRHGAFTRRLAKVEPQRRRPPRCVVISFRRWHGWPVTMVW